MKRIYIVLLVLIGITISCTKNFEDFNTDKKKPIAVPGEYLFANAQKALADQEASTNVNLNIFKLIAQYWTECTYTDETNYDLINRSIPDYTYRTYYRDILEDFKAARTSLASQPLVDPELIAIRDNQYLIIDLMESYCYQELVDIFGDVPYTEALDIENISPAYDDAFTIYQDLIARTDNAINNLDEAYASFGSSDLYFGGDIAKWRKFGYSLKVKLGIALADFNPGMSQTLIESAYAGAFTPDELCQIEYPGGSNSNPLWVDLVGSGRHDFVPANTLVDAMNTLEDPRRPAYMDLFNGAYVGGTYGTLNSYSQFSHIAAPITEQTYPMTIIDGTEIAFYLAEAAARGYSVGHDAEFYYNAAIRSSFIHWGLSDADADAYLAKTEVAYSTAAGDYKQKIGKQAWLAYYLRGLIAWNTWRRLDAPDLYLPPLPKTDDGQVPKRFTWPVNEQTLNAANYYSAVKAIGSDNMVTRIFWDIN